MSKIKQRIESAMRSRPPDLPQSNFEKNFMPESNAYTSQFSSRSGSSSQIPTQNMPKSQNAYGKPSPSAYSQNSTSSTRRAVGTVAKKTTSVEETIPKKIHHLTKIMFKFNLKI